MRELHIHMTAREGGGGGGYKVRQGPDMLEENTVGREAGLRADQQRGKGIRATETGNRTSLVGW